VLPAGVTATLALVQLLALGALSVLDPALSVFNWPILLTYVFFLSVLSILVSVINQADMRLIDRQTDQLSESASQLQAILDNSTALIYLKDLQGRYFLVNRFFEELFNLSRDEVIGKTAQDVFPQELAEIYCQNDHRVVRSRKPLEIEEPVHQTASTFTFFSVKFPLLNTAGEMYAICNISTDITVRKQVEEMLRYQSVRDPLTNLFNRRYMEEILGREIQRAKRSRKTIGIIMGDIDHLNRSTILMVTRPGTGCYRLWAISFGTISGVGISLVVMGEKNSC